MKLNDKIWIAGCDGFVGKRLWTILKSLGYSKVLGTGRDLDLFDDRAVSSFIDHNNFDVIFNCAGKVGGIAANIADPYVFLYDNLKIQNNIIHYSGLNEVKTVVCLGSSCIYPKDYPIQPLKEEFLLASYPEKTNEAYSIAKIAGLKLCEYANKKFPKTHFISLMPSNLYGPGDHMDSESSHALAALISRVYNQKKNGMHDVTIWGTGKPRREWLYVDDLIDCMLWSVDNLPRNFHKFVNVGTGIDTSMVDLANMIISKFDFSCRLNLDTSKPDGMLRKCLDVSLINSMGWSAKTSLGEGLNRTISWYLESKK